MALVDGLPTAAKGLYVAFSYTGYLNQLTSLDSSC